MTEKIEPDGARVAVINGGAIGIGAGAARRLDDLGLRVAIVDRDGNSARRLATQLSDRVLALRADVSVEADVDETPVA